MSRSLSRMQAAVLGLVVLSGVALGGWAVFQIGSRQRLFADTYELRAGFTEAHGLDRGTPVRVRGIDAGQVVAVELPDDPNGKVFVRMRLDKKFQGMIPTDSHARVLNEGMLGSRLINIEPGKERTARLQNGDEIAVAQDQNLSDIMQEATKTLQEIRDSNGTLAKLLKTDEAHKEVLQLVKETQQMVRKGEETFQQSQETLAAVKQDADAIKRLPIIRGYIEDAHALIYRPDQNSDRRVYSAQHLFDPGQATLNDAGRAHLNNLAPWIEAGKVKDSELVVITYADAATAELPAPTAQTLTQKRSEAVVNYLHDTMKAHKTGFWSSRKVVAVGMGYNSPPVPEKEPLAPDRIEIVLFTPR